MIRIYQTKKIFNLDEAKELLPVVTRATRKSNDIVKRLLLDLEHGQNREQIEKAIDEEVKRWQNKMQLLGVDGKGLWLVDFDCGNGFYCWKYPETSLDHWHGYAEGYQSRKKIS